MSHDLASESCVRNRCTAFLGPGAGLCTRHGAPGAGQPQHSVDEQTIVLAVSPLIAVFAWNKWFNAPPLPVRQLPSMAYAPTLSERKVRFRKAERTRNAHFEHIC